MTHFKREEEITKELSKHAHEIHKGKHILVCREESVGVGVFDYAIFEIDRKRFAKRVRSGLRTPITSESMISVLLHLRNRSPRSVDYLQKATGVNRKHLKENVLMYLLKRKYIIMDKNGNFLKSASYEDFVKFCIAVESKLERWKAALGQAYRYKEFADMTYVALSSRFAENARRNIGDFRKMNVGLIEVSKNNGIKLVFKPRKEKPRSRISRQLCNEVLIKKHHRRFLRSNSVRAFFQASK